MRVLGIETSCDETAVCMLECSGDFSGNFTYRILGDALISQIAIHAPYGGVFPNLAKREHQKNLVPLLRKALTDSELLVAHGLPDATVSCQMSAVSPILERELELLAQLAPFLAAHEKPAIDCIAVTAGPGLEPALWVGVNFARALAIAWGLPLVAVNHMEGHIVASVCGSPLSALRSPPHSDSAIRQRMSDVHFPAIALLVSGGHTELQLVKGLGDYALIGETRDDAAGEAFDKIARILGLPYPGGPEISRLAAEARESGLVSPAPLPRPMFDSGDYDFSFSGLKTAARKLIEAHQPISDDLRAAFAREAEEAIVEVLVSKTVRAAEEHGAQTIIVGGGVSANAYLRTKLSTVYQEASPPGLPTGTELPNAFCEAKPRRLSHIVAFPPEGLSTDNAVMIALAGYFRALQTAFVEPEELRADGNMRL